MAWFRCGGGSSMPQFITTCGDGNSTSLSLTVDWTNATANEKTLSVASGKKYLITATIVWHVNTPTLSIAGIEERTEPTSTTISDGKCKITQYSWIGVATSDTITITPSSKYYLGYGATAYEI